MNCTASRMFLYCFKPHTDKKMLKISGIPHKGDHMDFHRTSFDNHESRKEIAKNFLKCINFQEI